MLSVLPPTNQTCIATNQVVAGCVKLFQKVGNAWFFFFQQYLYMLRVFLVAASDVTPAY